MGKIKEKKIWEKFRNENWKNCIKIKKKKINSKIFLKNNYLKVA